MGGAYRFNESWSASFTTAYETAGKQTKADFSAGVGAHYSFK
ncbi:YadA-like family protein [Vibrio sp. 10N.286.49.B1]